MARQRVERQSALFRYYQNLLSFLEPQNHYGESLDPYQVQIHSLRHTYAYLLKSSGVHVTTAQRLLGHSDPKMTLAIYTQVLDHEIDDSGIALKQWIESSRKIEKPSMCH